MSRAKYGEGHALTLTPGSKPAGVCECEEKFTATTVVALAKKWEDHVAAQRLLTEAADAVRREYDARIEGEAAIVRLLDLGISSHKITEAIGPVEGTEEPIMSPTTVQRIGRRARSGQTSKPRRRRVPNGS